jgi:hypothetical protein
VLQLIRKPIVLAAAVAGLDPQRRDHLLAIGAIHDPSRVWAHHGAAWKRMPFPEIVRGYIEIFCSLASVPTLPIESTSSKQPLERGGSVKDCGLNSAALLYL